ncbi:MAG TPA: hypothetical protein VK864_00420 [Longimicrobiales bacterium]|nr:hypothetical protein [Longimicrobiales bacterium]
MHHRTRQRAVLPVALITLTTLTACQEAAAPDQPAAPGAPLYAAARIGPTGKGIGTRSYSIGPRTRYRLEWHNGPVMLGSVRVYLIMYGDWADPTGAHPTQAYLADFAASLNASSYLKINSLYGDGTASPDGSLIFGRSIAVGYPYGQTLTDGDIAQVVSDAVTTGLLPIDMNGIYAVVASQDVWASSGLGTAYCAFRNNVIEPRYNQRLKFVFIGHPARNPAQCAPQLSGPGGDYAADAMVSLLAVEISNTITDPNLDGWYDRLGLEMADKCAWDFGPTYQAPNGALANIQLDNRHYLLPRLWVQDKRNSGYCGLALPGT